MITFKLNSAIYIRFLSFNIHIIDEILFNDWGKNLHCETDS